MRARPVKRAVLFACGVLAILYACTDASDVSSPGDRYDARIGFAPQYVYLGNSSYVGEPINRIRLTARNLATNAIVGTLIVDVDPTAEDWNLAVDVELEDEINVVVTIELINVTSGLETVQWSGLSEPISLSPSQRVHESASVKLYQGPPENLGVTQLSLSPDSLVVQEGSSSLLSSVIVGPPTAAAIWSSDDATIAVVDQTGRVTGVRDGEARVIAVAGPKSDTARVRVTQRVSALTVAPDTQRINSVGAQTTFTARSFDPRGTEVLGSAVTWSVADANIVESLGNGGFRAKAAGTSRVFATSVAQPTVRDTGFVIVAQVVATLNVTPPLDTIAPTDTTRFTATGRDANGNIAIGAASTWTSSDTTIATVDGSGLARGRRDGAVTITARAGTVQAQGALVVRTPGPQRVVISPDSARINALGFTAQLSAVVLDIDGAPLTGESVTWSTLDPTRVSVNGNGLVTALAIGRARVVASVNPADTVIVEVLQVPARVTVTPAAPTLMIGDSVVLTAAIADSNNIAMVGVAATWRSSDSTIIRISNAGVARALRAGGAVITASYNDASGTASVNVNAADLKVLSFVTVPADTLVDGDSVRVLLSIKNQGNAPAAASQIALQVRDAATGAVLRAALLPLPAVAAGVTVPLSATVLLTPDVTWPDSVTGRVVLDSLNAVPESDESNNSAQTTARMVRFPVTMLTMTPDTLRLVGVGASGQLTAIAHDRLNRAALGAIAYTSRNPAIATVDNAGLVSGVVGGSTWVVATVQGKADSTFVIVSLPNLHVSSVRVQPDSLTVGAPATITSVIRNPTATAVPAFDFSLTIINHSVDTANSRIVIFQSAMAVPANDSVVVTHHFVVDTLTHWADSVSVQARADTSGVINESDESDNVAVTARVAIRFPVRRVSVTPDTVRLTTLGASAPLSVQLFDHLGRTLNRAVTFVSLHPAIAGVDASGLVTALAEGSTRVTAHSEGKADTTVVIVSSANLIVRRLAVTPDTLLVGGTALISGVVANTGTAAAPASMAGFRVLNAAGNAVVIGGLVPVPAIAAGDSIALNVPLNVDTLISWPDSVKGAVTLDSTHVVPESNEADNGFESATHAVRYPVARVTTTPDTMYLNSIGARGAIASQLHDQRGRLLSRPVGYSSTNAGVAGVDGAGNVIGHSVGSTRIVAQSEGKADTSTVIVRQVPAMLTVAPDAVSLPVGDSLLLTTTLTDSSGTAINDTISWHSANDAIATVDADGRVRAVGSGTTGIHASYGSLTAQSVVTVHAANLMMRNLVVTPDTLHVGGGATVSGVIANIGNAPAAASVAGLRILDAAGSAVVTGSMVPVPAIAAGDSVSINIPLQVDTLIAWPDSVKGSVTLDSTHVVTESNESDNSFVSAVHAVRYPAAMLQLSADTVYINALDGLAVVSAVVRDRLGRALTNRSIAFSSQNDGIAGIDSTGHIRGNAVGSAFVFAQSESARDSALVIVRQIPASLSVTPDSALLVLGDSTQLLATVKDSTAHDVAVTVTWLSQDTTVAAVDSNGHVHAVGNGTTTVTASYGALSDLATIRVTGANLLVRRLTVTPDTLNVGGAAVVSGVIANTGTAPAAASLAGFRVLNAAGSAVVIGSMVPVPAIAAGDSVSINIPLNVDTLITWPDSVKGTVTLDSTRVVTESNETDNTFVTATHAVRYSVATVLVAPDTLRLSGLGTQGQLTATLRDRLGRTMIRAVTFTSQDTIVARVDQDGNVTGYAAGETVVTAQSESRNGSAVVIVTAPDLIVNSLTVDPDTLAEGGSFTIAYTVGNRGDAGAGVTNTEIRLIDESRHAVLKTFTVATAAVSAGDSVLVVLPLALDTAIQWPDSILIDVVADAGVAVPEGDDSNNHAYVKRTVRLRVASLQLGADTLYINGLDSLAFVNPVLRDRMERILTGRLVVFSSQNDSIAAIDTSGRIRGNRAGSTHVFAQSGSARDSALVIVRAPNLLVRSLTVTPDTLVQGGTATLRGVIANSGSAAASASQLGLRVVNAANGTLVRGGLVPVPALVAGDSVVINIPVVVDTLTAWPDSLRGSVILDSTNVVRESNEADNRFTTIAHAVRLRVASVVLSPDSLSLDRVGVEGQLTAVARDQYNRTVARSIFFSAADTSIAVVDQNGLVTARAAGRTTVTASSEGRSDQAAVVVRQADLVVSALEITPDSAAEGGQLTVTARIANIGDGSAGESETMVKIVDAATDAIITTTQLTMNALPPGDTTFGQVAIPLVTGAPWPDSIRIRAYADFTASIAESNEANNIRTSPSLAITLRVASVVLPFDTLFINALGREVPAAGTAKDRHGRTLAGRLVEYLSDNDAVVSVDANGRVRANGIGATSVFARSELAHDTMRVIVRQLPAQLTVVPDSAALLLGDSVQLNAVITDSTGHTITASAVWHAQDTTIATVSASGVVRAVRTGSTTVTASYAGLNDNALIRVKAPNLIVRSLVVTPDTLHEGGVATLRGVVFNAGNAPAPGWQLGFQLVDAATGALARGAWMPITPLSAGDSSIVTIPITLDTLTSWPDSVKGVLVADSNNVVRESNEADNRFFSTAHVVRFQVAEVNTEPDTLRLFVTGSGRLGTRVQDRRHRILDRPYTYSSVNSSVATVDQAGLVSGVSAGTTHIITLSEGRVDSTTVIVIGQANLTFGGMRVTPDTLYEGAPVLINGFIRNTGIIATPATIMRLRVVSAAAPGTELKAQSLPVLPVPPGDSVPVVLALFVDTLIAWPDSVIGLASLDTTFLVAESNEGDNSFSTGVHAVRFRVATLTVAPARMLLHAIGDTARITVGTRDRYGRALTGRAIGFVSSKPGDVAVDNAGLVRALTADSAYVRVASETRRDSVLVVVEQRVTDVAALSNVTHIAVVDQEAPDSLGVIVKDANGHGIEGVTVNWTGPPTFTSTTNALGIARTKWKFGTRAGPQQMQACVAGFPCIVFRGNAKADKPHGASKKKGDEQLATVGTIAGDSLVLEVADRFGNPVPDAVVKWLSNGGGIVSDSITTTDTLGFAMVQFAIGTVKGQKTVDARVMDGANVVATQQFKLNGKAGSPHGAKKNKGGGLTAVVAPTLGDSLEIQIIDEYGNGVDSVSVTFAVQGGGGKIGTAATQTVTTDSDGFARVFWTLGTKAGSHKLRVTVDGTSVAVEFDNTAKAAGPKKANRKGDTDDQTVVVAQVAATALELTVTDEFDNPVDSALVEWNIEARSGGAGALSDSSTFTNESGKALVTWTAPTVRGTYYVRYSVKDSASVVTDTGSFRAHAKPDLPRKHEKSTSSDNQDVEVAQIAPNALELMVSDTFGNAVEGALVTFILRDTTKGATLSANLDTTNVAGKASVSWNVGRKSGKVYVDYTVRFNGTQYAAGTFTANARAGRPDSLSKKNDDQTGVVGTILNGDIEIEIKDVFGNPVPDVQVDWRPVTGTVSDTDGVTVTDTLGVTGVHWTLGTLKGTQSLRAIVHLTTTEVDTLVFTATAKPGNPNNQPGLRLSTSAPLRAGQNRVVESTAAVFDEYGNALESDDLDWGLCPGTTVCVTPNPILAGIGSIAPKLPATAPPSATLTLDAVASGVFTVVARKGSTLAGSLTLTIQ